MDCKKCGEYFPEERAELGFDYCTKPACVEACLRPLRMASLGVNKASDQYVLLDDLELPEPKATIAIDPGWAPLLRNKSNASTPTSRRKGTVQIIRELEAALDAELAGETDPRKRAKLVNDHNARLRRLNIRYRRALQR
jgi:hypothetical protein